MWLHSQSLSSRNDNLSKKNPFLETFFIKVHLNKKVLQSFCNYHIFKSKKK